MCTLCAACRVVPCCVTLRCVLRCSVLRASSVAGSCCAANPLVRVASVAGNKRELLTMLCGDPEKVDDEELKRVQVNNAPLHRQSQRSTLFKKQNTPANPPFHPSFRERCAGRVRFSGTPNQRCTAHDRSTQTAAERRQLTSLRKYCCLLCRGLRAPVESHFCEINADRSYSRTCSKR